MRYHRLLIQTNIEIHKKFPNPQITRPNRLYSAEPNYEIPKNYIELKKWKFERKETIPFINRTRFILPSISLERKRGKETFEELKKGFEGNTLDPKHPYCVRVSIILKNILDALNRERKKMRDASEFTFWHRVWLRLIRRSPPSMSHLDGLHWEILIANHPEIAGHCCPGGKIVLSTTLVEHYKNDAEIATFLAHEVAHIVARHAAEKITRTLWIYVICQMFVNINDLSERMKSIMGRLPFNRRIEYEADYIGLLLMASAGYDPRVAPKVYEESGKMDEGYNDIKLPSFLCHHPPGRKRAKALTRPKIMEKALILYNDHVRARCVVE